MNKSKHKITWLLGSLLVVACLHGGCPAVAQLERPFETVTPEQVDKWISNDRTHGGKVVSNERLTRLGKRLAKFTHAEGEYLFTFKELQREEPNAFSLFNGSVYVTTGTLKIIGDDEDLLAAVLGHELAHVVQRHIASKKIIIDAIERARLGGDSPSDEGIVLATVKAVSREQEYDADRYGMLYLARAGISPMAGVHMLQQFKRAGLDHTPIQEKTADHPTTSDRITDALRTVADINDLMNKFDFGVMYLNEGAYREAIAMFDAFLLMFRDNREAYTNRGLTYYRVAIRNLEPDQFMSSGAVAVFDTGFVTRRGGKMDEDAYAKAEEDLQQALRLDPNYAAAHVNLGNLYRSRAKAPKAAEQSKREAQALEEYQKALKANPRLAPGLNDLGVLHAEKDPKSQEALKLFRQAVAVDPRLPAAHFNLALALEANNAKEEALQEWRAFLRLNNGGERTKIARQHLTQLDSKSTQPVPAGPTKNTKEEGLAGIKLGEQADAVQKKLGAPEKTAKGASQKQEIWDYPRKGLTLVLESGRVVRIMLGGPQADRKIATKSGITLGSSANQVEVKYGFAAAIRKEAPYEIWEYPSVNLGFFFVDEKVEKIFVYEGEA